MSSIVSLFSGCGSFDLGFHRAGWSTALTCEYDPQARQVLEARFPGVPISTDIRELSGHGLQADCVVFGSPCQDLSKAGRGAGLAGERSGLFLEAIRVIEEMRDDGTTGTISGPRFALWENVPGALSSNGGWDFATVLREFQRIGALDISWRVLDAADHGLPQRRERLFLIADFGGESAPAVLADRTRGGWHDAASAGQGSQHAAGAASGTASHDLGSPQLARCLTTSQQRNDASVETIILQAGTGTGTVRRLTPLECERLQGLPDGWTAVGDLSDTARYRLTGNCGALPVLQMIALNMLEAL